MAQADKLDGPEAEVLHGAPAPPHALGQYQKQREDDQARGDEGELARFGLDKVASPEAEHGNGNGAHGNGPRHAAVGAVIEIVMHHPLQRGDDQPFDIGGEVREYSRERPQLNHCGKRRAGICPSRENEALLAGERYC